MEEKIKNLIQKLKDENRDREIKINGGKLSEYAHTVKVHEFNLTLEIIKELEKIL